jgi:hypothetical protein
MSHDAQTYPASLGVAIALLLACALGPGQSARADAIRIEGVWHEDVVVVAGERMHYVLMPEDGAIRNVRNADVEEGGLILLEDGPEREALRNKWEAARAKAEEADTPHPEPQASQAIETPPPAADVPRTVPLLDSPRPISPPPPERPAGLPGAPVISVDADGRKTGMVRHVRLNNVPLGDALRVILRPLGLDYVNMGNYLFISTPERLRREPLESIDTRFHPTRGGQGATLPKIVVRSPAL